jgi:para-nitrobenzyl esterase
VEELKNMDYKTIFNANTKATAGKFGASKIESLYPPFVDGKILPKHPLEAFKDGFAKDIDFIAGTCENEFKFWSFIESDLVNIDDDGVIERISSIFKSKSDKLEEAKHIIKTYKKAREGFKPTSPYDLLDAVMTDFAFRIPAIRFTEAQQRHNPNTYMYLFTMKLLGKEEKYGALHGMETNFVFGNLFEEVTNPTGNKDPFAELNPIRSQLTEKLSSNLMNVWVNFARTGNPNHEDIPEWKTYELKNRFTMKFDAVCELISNPMGIENETIRKYLF